VTPLPRFCAMLFFASNPSITRWDTPLRATGNRELPSLTWQHLTFSGVSGRSRLAPRPLAPVKTGHCAPSARRLAKRQDSDVLAGPAIVSRTAADPRLAGAGPIRAAHLPTRSKGAQLARCQRSTVINIRGESYRLLEGETQGTGHEGHRGSGGRGRQRRRADTRPGTRHGRPRAKGSERIGLVIEQILSR
jgi:hypothetical protein